MGSTNMKKKKRVTKKKVNESLCGCCPGDIACHSCSNIYSDRTIKNLEKRLRKLNKDKTQYEIWWLEAMNKLAWYRYEDALLQNDKNWARLEVKEITENTTRIDKLNEKFKNSIR